MYFHLIGIKEKDGNQYQLDILIGGVKEVSEIREFLEARGVVSVSLEEYDKPPEEFGKIHMTVSFKEKEFSIVTFSDTVEKSIRYVFSLGLVPKNVMVTDGSVPEEEIQQQIQTIAKEYEAEHKHREDLQEGIKEKELKKYENKDIQHALKVINSNIDRIDQILLIGRTILGFDESKILTDISNELKKIRLGTNFNKMVQLLLDAQSHIAKAEDAVFLALDDKKFLIDRNSTVTNIDVITQYAELMRSEEKFVLKKPLTLTENLYVTAKQGMIFSVFF
ncbi:MAG: hypothetical protein LBD11_03035 [Candidatus Peribacteria bacterium]|jgi:soluble cytochrome b562|nr:hypothetical protein [Candidatus Peribacteria bacterium]